MSYKDETGAKPILVAGLAVAGGAMLCVGFLVSQVFGVDVGPAILPTADLTFDTLDDDSLAEGHVRGLR